jgi:hypothetical protein
MLFHIYRTKKGNVDRHAAGVKTFDFDSLGANSANVCSVSTLVNMF